MDLNKVYSNKKKSMHRATPVIVFNSISFKNQLKIVFNLMTVYSEIHLYVKLECISVKKPSS